MNAAFELCSAPSPGSRIVWISRQRGAGLACNAEITLVVLRQVADATRLGVIPNLLPIPIGEETRFPERLAGWQSVKLDLLEVPARGRLIAPQSGESKVEGLECTDKRLDLAELAAARGVGPVENAEGRLLLRDRLRREDVDEMQRPFLRHPVTVLVGLREVITGIQKQHGHIRNPRAQQIQDDHIFGLKATRDPGTGFSHCAQDGVQNLLGVQALHSYGYLVHVHSIHPFVTFSRSNKPQSLCERKDLPRGFLFVAVEFRRAGQVKKAAL